MTLDTDQCSRHCRPLLGTVRSGLCQLAIGLRRHFLLEKSEHTKKVAIGYAILIDFFGFAIEGPMNIPHDELRQLLADLRWCLLSVCIWSRISHWYSLL